MHWFLRAGIAVGVGTLYAFLLLVFGAPLIDGAFSPLVVLIGRGATLIVAFVSFPMVPMCVYGLLTRLSGGERPLTGSSETRCRKCQYILRGITEPRCPECGERI